MDNNTKILITVFIVSAIIIAIIVFTMSLQIEKLQEKLRETELTLNHQFRYNKMLFESRAALSEQFNADREEWDAEILKLQKKISKLEKANAKYKRELAVAKDVEVVNEGNPVELLKKYCSNYGVDYKLAVAISRLETGNFKSSVFTGYNNFGGMRANGDYYKYGCQAEGAEAFVKMLKTYYIDQGLDTPEAMQPKYCPGNSEWAGLVRQIMSEV